MVTWDEWRKTDTSKWSNKEVIAFFCQALADNAFYLGPAKKTEGEKEK